MRCGEMHEMWGMPRIFLGLVLNRMPCPRRTSHTSQKQGRLWGHDQQDDRSREKALNIHNSQTICDNGLTQPDQFPQADPQRNILPFGK